MGAFSMLMYNECIRRKSNVVTESKYPNEIHYDQIERNIDTLTNIMHATHNKMKKLGVQKHEQTDQKDNIGTGY